MSEQMGAIHYDVDFDTSQLTTGANKINATLGDVQKSAERTDKSFDSLGASLGKTRKYTDEETAALRKLLGQIDPTVAATQRLDAMTEQLGAAFDKGQFSASQYAANLAKLDTQYNKLDGSGKKAEISSGGFGAALKPLAAAVAAVITVQTLKQWGAMAEQFTLLQSRIKRLTPDLATAETTYKSLLTTASATGQTMPQTVKLWETLTTSLKSLGATNAQVLTLTSTLQKIGTIGGSSAEETARALRQLGQALGAGTLRAEEYNSIAEQTPELIRQLAAASGKSMGEFRQTMLDGKLSSEQLFDLLLQRVPAVNEEFAKMPRSASAAGNAVTVAFGAALSKLDQALGASQALASSLDTLAFGISKIAGNATAVDVLGQKFRDLTDLQKQLSEQQSGWLTNPRMIKQTEDRIRTLKDEIAQLQAGMAPTKTINLPKAAPTTTEDGQKELKALAEQNGLIRAQGEERVKLQTIQKLGVNATQQERDLAVALALDTYRLSEAEKARQKAKTDGASAAKKAESEAAALVKKENEEARRGYEANQKTIAAMAAELSNAALKGEDLALAQARAKLNKFADPEDVAEVERLTRAIVAQQTAIANKQLAGSVDPMIGASQGLDKQLADIKTLEEAQILSKQRADELRLASETAYQEQMRLLQEETFRQAAVGNELMFAGIDALANSGTQALSGLLTGTTSLKDALGGVAQTILGSVIGAFSQAGVEWVKQELMKQAAVQTTTAVQTAGIGTVASVQAGATTAIAATTTTTAATTGTAVATSMAPAAGLSSIASFGSAAVIGGAALLATMALASSFGGGRQYGGGVSGNKMYRVNEGGAPEIFNAAGGKQYMMPNTRGEVVSNKDASGGGGGGAAPVVNVNNYSSSTASASARFSEADNRYIVDVVVGDMAAGGKSGQMVNRITGTKRAGS